MFADLEDQMAAMTATGFVGDGSPDRCDALVWALSELMLGHAAQDTELGFCLVDCTGMKYGLSDFSAGVIRNLPG
jgi:hypothetical protein